MEDKRAPPYHKFLKIKFLTVPVGQEQVGAETLFPAQVTQFVDEPLHVAHKILQEGQVATPVS